MTDFFVADPHWFNWMIVTYFFLGGIAGGSYAIATLVDLIGGPADREVAKIAYYIAFPLAALCGILLIIDLTLPMRFWHMVIQSERPPLPMFKYWSPMSIGSVGLLLFSLFSFFSFVGVLAEDGRLGLGRFRGPAALLHHGPIGMLFQLLGAASGFFLAGYTGALLTATNQPLWSDSSTISGLFIASAASTGIAAMLVGVYLFRRGIPHGTIARLEWVDNWAIGLEAVMIAIFVISLGSLAGTLFATWAGWLLAFVAFAGLLVPFALHLRPKLLGARSPLVAAALVLVGGLLLRIAIVGAAPAALSLAAATAQ